jgi:hypothetical protein
MSIARTARAYIYNTQLDQAAIQVGAWWCSSNLSWPVDSVRFLLAEVEFPTDISLPAKLVLSKDNFL